MASPTTLITVRQLQGPPYNHPRGDLLDGGRRREYLDTAVPLYKAIITGDGEAAKVILQGHQDFVRCSINENKETPLHVAAAGHSALQRKGKKKSPGQSTKFVSYLVNMMNVVDLELQNEDGNTAFCLAAISGNVDIAKIMVEKNPALPLICGSDNMTPLHLAAFHGNKDMVIFLYNQRMRGECLIEDDINGVLVKCVQANFFGMQGFLIVCGELNVNTPPKEESIMEKLWGVIYEKMRARKMIPPQESNGTPLLRLLWKRIMEKPRDVISEIMRGPMIEKNNMETYPSEILFIAAKTNNRHFLVELIHEYPDLIWKRNDDGQTIFHIAVTHRHHDIYNLLYDIGSKKDLITPIRDKQGNNILHLVGKIPQKTPYGDWMATPFEMFNEFHWYKEVEGIVPPPCREMKNASGETPQELFTRNHKDLVSIGMKWVNDTINISMVVAVLVSTIGFSVAYSIPGGFDQNNGYPILRSHNYFIAFMVLDVISFILSTTSIVFFLSIFLSRHSGDMDALLLAWVTGQLLLLASVCFLAIAFIISLFILYFKSTNWTYIGYTLIFILISVWGGECGYNVINAVITAYGSRFGPEKHGIYRKIAFLVQP
ncbi:putative ankyrin repeat-containing domain, PGG domain, ankyrin repeat-containing domain superfamily [Helianthus annuus]|nr:putative ankyrin repeat-containing domain, PGG domain, ankyrin repeat-containing domain superfamily [Helianthus annuus]